MTGTPEPHAPMSNLQLRVISAVILAIVVLALTWLGGAPFRFLSVVIAVAVFWEWCRMSRTADNATNQAVAAIPLALAMIALLFGYPAQYVLGIVAAGTLLAFVHAAATGIAQWASGGVAYAGFTGAALAFLRGDDAAGLAAILFLFAVVWATDILAYFVGRAVGGPKLAPAISPGKTQSGALGGLVGGAVAALLVVLWLGTANVLSYMLLAVVVSALSQGGDLFESWVKRRHGVKDSSHIIPGHGGVMDRVDGLAVAAMALYIAGVPGGGMNTPALGLF